RELITSDLIRIHSDATDWKDSIRKSCEDFIENSAIEPRYFEAIYRSKEELAHYYVVVPGNANTQSRPEDE
ncbi:PTS sugar transporter subunit IIA, partial [Vibrio parahaemolyticus]|nr:PTS sugar transporter subunit IIA [Vibrio parahaemolyticus]